MLTISKTELENLSLFEKNYLNLLTEQVLYKSYEPIKIIVDYSKEKCVLVSVLFHNNANGFEKIRNYKFFGKDIADAEKFLSQFRSDFSQAEYQQRGVE